MKWYAHVTLVGAGAAGRTDGGLGVKFITGGVIQVMQVTDYWAGTMRGPIYCDMMGNAYLDAGMIAPYVGMPFPSSTTDRPKFNGRLMPQMDIWVEDTPMLGFPVAFSNLQYIFPVLNFEDYLVAETNDPRAIALGEKWYSTRATAGVGV